MLTELLPVPHNIYFNPCGKTTGKMFEKYWYCFTFYQQYCNCNHLYFHHRICQPQCIAHLIAYELWFLFFPLILKYHRDYGSWFIPRKTDCWLLRRTFRKPLDYRRISTISKSIKSESFSCYLLSSYLTQSSIRPYSFPHFLVSSLKAKQHDHTGHVS